MIGSVSCFQGVWSTEVVMEVVKSVCKKGVQLILLNLSKLKNDVPEQNVLRQNVLRQNTSKQKFRKLERSRRNTLKPIVRMLIFVSLSVSFSSFVVAEQSADTSGAQQLQLNPALSSQHDLIQPALNSQQFQKKWIQQLASGKDSSALEQSVHFTAFKPSASRINKGYLTIASFDQKVNLLRERLQQLFSTTTNKNTPLTLSQFKRLSAAYENLTVAHLMLNEHYQVNLSKIQRAGIAAEDKLLRSQQNNQQKMERILGPLSSLLKRFQKTLTVSDKEASLLLFDPAFNAQLNSAVEVTLQRLNDEHIEQPVRILRNSLPYRQASLARRSPASTVSIVPSYESIQLPTSRDLASTTEAPLSSLILKKAEELEHDYIKIYDFVHNQIKTEWYAGGSKGAEGTLLQLSGNDVDQASLLIALFRASGLASRYVHGIVELPVTSINGSQGLTTAEQAVELLNAAGMAYSPVIRGGKIAAFELEYSWVSAYVPYNNYRGAVVDRSGEQWLPLMPALKEYQLEPASGLLRKAGINIDTTIKGYLLSRQSSSLRSQIKQNITYFLAGNQEEPGYEQQLGSIKIKPSQIGLIPNTLPVSVVAVHTEESVLSEERQQKVRFIVRNGRDDNDFILLNKTITLSQLANKRVTFSYMPASIDDQNLTNLFGGLDRVPTYLIQLRPEIKLNGRKLFTGENAMPAGQLHRLDIEIISPAGKELLKHTLVSGSYHAMTFATGEKSFPFTNDEPGDTEFNGARILSNLGQQYNRQWIQAENEFARLLNVAVVRPLPSFNLVSNDFAVQRVSGEPQQLIWKAVTLDAGFKMNHAIGREMVKSEPSASEASNATEPLTALDNARDFTRLSALQGSTLEHQLFEELFKVDSISADKGIQEANSKGEPVLRINAGNRDSQLALLSHPVNVIEDVRYWLTRGFEVVIPQTTITYNDWTGSVWQVVDNATGNGGYFIGGGLAGGSTSVRGSRWIMTWLQDALEKANSPEPNKNPGAVFSIAKYNDPGYLKGIVGEALKEPFIVQVRDREGLPVVGASVVFSTNNGELIETSAISDRFGLAWTTLKAGQSTDFSPIYQMQKKGDRYPSKAAVTNVTASVDSELGQLTIAQPFIALSFAGEATSIVSLTKPHIYDSTSSDLIVLKALMPGAIFDPIAIIAEDQYGNRVANADVTASMTAIYEPCPGYEEGYGPLPPESVSPGMLHLDFTEKDQTFVSFKTTTQPVFLWSRMGKTASTGYPVTVSGAKTQLYFPFRTVRSCARNFRYGSAGDSFYSADGIHSYAAARPGEKFRVPLHATYVYWHSPVHPEVIVSKPISGKAVFEVGNGGFATPAVQKGGLYYTDVTVGPVPGEHRIKFKLTAVGEQAGGGIPNGMELKSLVMEPVYAVRTRIEQVKSKLPGADEFSKYIKLSRDGVSLDDVILEYHIEPESYHAATVDVDILQDGQLFQTFIGSSVTAKGQVILPAGLVFDPDKHYQVELVLNRSTPFEMKSDIKTLEFIKDIVLNYSRKLSISHDVDLLNDSACLMQAAYQFELAEEATVTLEVDNKKLIDNKVYPKGQHELIIGPDELSANYYLSTLTATSTSNGFSEEKEGEIKVTFDTRNNLPVGHTLVKGVNVSNGNLSLASTDFSVPARVQPIAFQRFYSSNNSGSLNEMGVGWSHSYSSSLRITSCGEIVISGGTGGGNRFVEDKDGNLVPQKGYHGSLVANHAERTFDFYAKDGTRYHYKNNGRVSWDLEYIEDTNNNKIKLNYDSHTVDIAKLISVEDSAGRMMTFTYAKKQITLGTKLKRVELLSQVSFADKISVSFSYDNYGNLLSANRSGGRIESYSYSIDSRRPLSRHKLSHYTDPGGYEHHYVYNENPVSVKVDETSMMFLPFSNVQAVTEPDAGVTRFGYDFQNRATTLTNTRQQDTVYTYNDYGSVTKVQKPIGHSQSVWAVDDVYVTQQTDANGNQTSFTYDEYANPLTETRPGQTVTKTTYHPPSSFSAGAGRVVKNRVASTTDANGNSTFFSYDSFGNLIQTLQADGAHIRHSYNAWGDRISSTDAKGKITRFNYDKYGNLIRQTDAAGNVTLTQRDELGQAISVTDANGNTTAYVYDEQQRLISTTDPLKGVTRLTYDALGNKLSESDANQHTTQFIYDKASRLVEVTDALKGVQSFTYDKEGNKTAETDYNGNNTTYVYDENNRLSRVNQPESRVIETTYDAVGNRLSESVSAINAQSPAAPATSVQTTRYVYDALNRVTRVIAPLNQVSTKAYDKAGNIVTQTDALMRATQFAYDKMNRVVKRTQPLNRITSYRYDLNGSKVEEIDANEVRRFYVYDAVNRLVKVIDGNGDTHSSVYDAVGNLVTTIDARLNQTHFKYDALNRKIKTVDANKVETEFEYDPVGNLKTVKMVNGNIVRHQYDALDRLLDSQDNLGQLTTKSYDANGNLLTETDANGEVTQQIFDGLNRVVEQRLPEGRILKTRYGVFHNKISETDAMSQVSSFVYDDLNRLVTQTYPDNITRHFSYDRVGNQLSETDRMGNVTRFEYDALNRPVKAIDALLKTTLTSYDAVGNKLSQMNKKGVLTSFTYDRENRLLTTTQAGLRILSLTYDEVGNKAIERDANGNESAFLYTPLNQVSEQSSPLAAITRYSYDDMGNQSSVTDAEGRVSQFSYDVRNRRLTSTNGNQETTTFTYDANGNLLTRQLPLGNRWTQVYDGAGRVVSITAPDGGVTRYGYDFNNNRLSQQDGLLNTTSFSYDVLNRQTGLTYPDGIAERYAYDANGNRTGLTDANGKVLTSRYDALNRKTRTSYPASDNPDGSDLVSIDYEYDDSNNLTVVKESFVAASAGSETPVRTTLNQYDDFDRKTRVTNGDGKVLSYAYDANGNRTRLTDADGLVTLYYFDALNRVSSVNNAQGFTRYRYDRSGLQTRVDYPNGTRADTAYDSAGRERQITHLQQSAVISRFDYERDINGNRKKQTESRGAEVEVTDYVYDVNDRLTETKISVAGVETETTRFTYDVAYNRLTEVKTQQGSRVVDKSYGYNSRNQVTEVTDKLDASQTAVYGYDNNGNRTAKQTTLVNENYIYDVRDQLKSIQQGGSTIGQFLYDYQGLRVAKTTIENNQSFTRKYVYDDQSVLIQTDASGNTLSKYDYGAKRLLSLNHVNEGAQFYLFDTLGSPVNLTKVDGSVQVRYQYDAFGNTRSQVGTSANVFGFTGHEKDEETGLYYFKARYYDPTLGQFLTQDAFEGMVDTPPSLHKYLYAYGNPTVWIDPDGNVAWLAAARDKLAEWADNTAKIAGNLDNQSRTDQVISAAAGIGAGVARAGEGIMATANYAANWVSAATSGFGNDKWAREHSRELDNSHDTAVNSAKLLASREGRSQIGRSVYGAYQKVKAGDTGAIAGWSSSFAELGTGSVVGSGVINSSKSIKALSGTIKESVKSVGRKVGKLVERVKGRVGRVPNSTAAPGPVNFMADSDRFFLNASKRSDVDPDGFFDVVAHGSPNKIQIETPNGPVLVDHRTAARMIEQQPGYNGQNVRLLSCSTGACETGFAQNLANKLNVEVQAPTDLLWAYPNGKTLVAPKAINGQPDLRNLGEIKIFQPKTNP